MGHSSDLYYPKAPKYSSSFLGVPFRILNMKPQKELLWGLWVSARIGGESADPKAAGCQDLLCDAYLEGHTESYPTPFLGYLVLWLGSPI